MLHGLGFALLRVAPLPLSIPCLSSCKAAPVLPCRSYYLNNFEDGHKQDALDLVTGGYAVVPGERGNSLLANMRACEAVLWADPFSLCRC